MACVGNSRAAQSGQTRGLPLAWSGGVRADPQQAEQAHPGPAADRVAVWPRRAAPAATSQAAAALSTHRVAIRPGPLGSNARTAEAVLGVRLRWLTSGCPRAIGVHLARGSAPRRLCADLTLASVPDARRATFWLTRTLRLQHPSASRWVRFGRALRTATFSQNGK